MGLGEMLSCSRSMEAVADVCQEPQLDGGFHSAALPQLLESAGAQTGRCSRSPPGAAWAGFAGTKGLEEEEDEG